MSRLYGPFLWPRSSNTATLRSLLSRSFSARTVNITFPFLHREDTSVLGASSGKISHLFPFTVEITHIYMNYRSKLGVH